MANGDGNPGMNKLARAIASRIRRASDDSMSDLILDFGVINDDMSLQTNTFPVPIPKGQYRVCRQLTLGKTLEHLTDTAQDGTHSHPGVGSGGAHSHNVLIPEKMRSIKAGDHVLVGWVQDDPVVIDVILSSERL